MDWQHSTLGEICELYQPKTVSGKDMTSGGRYPVFGANGIIGRYHDFNHEAPQLVIGCRGSVGAVHVTEPYSWITGNTMVVKPKGNQLSVRFVEYYLRGGVDLSPAISGTAQPQITRTSLSPIPISFPPLPEQQRIVTKLDAAFAALSEAQGHVERNRANARELFESYLNGVFEGKGDGWMEYTLPDLSDNLDSRRVPITKSDRKAGPYPYYGASGIVDHVHEYIFDEECLLISEDGANLLMRSTPIAFSVSGKYWVNNHAHILRFRDRATQKLVEHYLESIDLSPWITGAAQPKLNQSAMNSIPIWLPVDLNAREDLVQKLDAIQQETKQLESTYQQKLLELAGLKKGLLGAAFRGEL